MRIPAKRAVRLEGELLISKFGTILSSMFPYSIAFLIGWTVMLVIWVFAGIPLGPRAYATSYR